MSKSLEDHFGFLSDSIKLERYQAVIDRLVRPEHLIVDLGCGTGVLGLMALRAGARKVYFVEEDPIIEVARKTVADAGFSDKAEFFHANSHEVTLPERVDLAFCDHVGYFGFDYAILRLLADARQRFLKPDGIIVPAQVELKLAPVESVECRKLVGRWQDGSVPEEFGQLSATAANSKYGMYLKEEELLADAASLTTLELGAEAPPYMSWNVEFECARDGMLDGVTGWFDCKLRDEIHMTNSPIAGDSLLRPQAYLPLEKPVAVRAGEHVRVSVMVRHIDRVIGWIVELPDVGKRYAHSTFNSLFLDRETLTRAQPNRVAKLNDRGRARQVVLSYCDGQRTVAEVQELVQRDHPLLFPSALATSSFVTQVLSWDASE